LTQGRIIVQVETPESHRARALAVFQLGFTGGSPIGALGMGNLAAPVGPRPRADLSRRGEGGGARGPLPAFGTLGPHRSPTAVGARPLLLTRALATVVPILYARVHIEAIARDKEITPSPPPP
jgi:hypothetical protein